MTKTKFPPGVTEMLNFYVYRLIDPRNGQTFYVGKGRGNRVFDPRYEFDGSPITDSWANDLCGRILPERFRKKGNQNPVQYIN